MPTHTRDDVLRPPRPFPAPPPSPLFFFCSPAWPHRFAERRWALRRRRLLGTPRRDRGFRRRRGQAATARGRRPPAPRASARNAGPEPPPRFFSPKFFAMLAKVAP
ncbi:uncharacterized protein Tco025E_07268 [Trypanosoma conorhini]|uniref:Uncharacterized protein n=1 Tax=Trypanosoma conorhini TaxID=83891 RepID=A0A3R7NLA5_9TRYP|nr:uncharacterized protein Tco025E_07268 [Trypanosoma conorhini]RNF08158.1 hypothetical protein Tco025E_07268 [Trypanosoma conorhini]